jgi:hypothetical protein
MRYVDDVLGGIKGVSLMLSGGTLSHAKMMRAIELLGSKVSPRVNAAHDTKAAHSSEMAEVSA